MFSREIDFRMLWYIFVFSIYNLYFTFDAVSGKKLIPLGTSKAMRAALMLRTPCRNTCHERLSSFCLQPYGQPRMTVFGRMPPNPVVCTLWWINNYEMYRMKMNACEHDKFQDKNESYMCDNPSAIFCVTKMSTKPLTFSSSIIFRKFCLAVIAAELRLV